MIKVGDILTIKGYDYDQMRCRKKKWKVIGIYPHGVLCEHIKGIYKTFWNTAHLIENGYIPNFKDVSEKCTNINFERYSKTNKLLDKGAVYR